MSCGNPYVLNGYRSPMGVGGQRLGLHTGIDFKAELGDVVLAAAPGFVASAMYSEEVGNAVLIGHLLSEEGFAYFTVYLHLEDIKVERGQEVRRGEHIGTAGSTGAASGGKVHVHFQLCTFACLVGTRDGDFKGVEDPMKFLVGCYDARRTYDDNHRLVLSYPVQCNPEASQ